MIESPLQIIIAALAGLACGYSAGIGFKPRWSQPKNLYIQMCIGAFGMILALILIFLIS